MGPLPLLGLFSGAVNNVRAYDPTRLVAVSRQRLVGMETASEVLAVALAAGRHVVLEGPPGTGKSSLLRVVAEAAGVQLHFVEGNAELTPSRLVGHHDPAIVLAKGYLPEAFVPGALVDAVRDGGLLYLEELNRVPEETLNVLITALADGELHVPRVGRIAAHPNFRFVSAMNPYDAIGTARIGQAIYDRLCRIAIGYQDEPHEREIVSARTNIAEAAGAPQPANNAVKAIDEIVEIGVSVVRATRTHSDLRVGSSVRGAIDLVLLARGLAEVRGTNLADLLFRRGVIVDAALAALSGRVRVDEGSDRQPESIIVEIVDKVLHDRLHRPQVVDPEKAMPPA